MSGTHGKTTTTVMTTEALAEAGLDPTGLAGGRVGRWGGNARVGGDRLFVVEADEYDQAFLALAPTVAIVNNVEADHLECYGTLEDLEEAFVTFAGRAHGWRSWARTMPARADRRPARRTRWSGSASSDDADARIHDVVQRPDRTHARVRFREAARSA